MCQFSLLHFENCESGEFSFVLGWKMICREEWTGYINKTTKWWNYHVRSEMVWMTRIWLGTNRPWMNNVTWWNGAWWNFEQSCPKWNTFAESEKGNDIISMTLLQLSFLSDKTKISSHFFPQFFSFAKFISYYLESVISFTSNCRFKSCIFQVTVTKKLRQNVEHWFLIRNNELVLMKERIPCVIAFWSCSVGKSMGAFERVLRLIFNKVLKGGRSCRHCTLQLETWQMKTLF